MKNDFFRVFAFDATQTIVASLSCDDIFFQDKLTTTHNQELSDGLLSEATKQEIIELAKPYLNYRGEDGITYEAMSVDEFHLHERRKFKPMQKAIIDDLEAFFRDLSGGSECWLYYVKSETHNVHRNISRSSLLSILNDIGGGMEVYSDGYQEKVLLDIGADNVLQLKQLLHIKHGNVLEKLFFGKILPTLQNATTLTELAPSLEIDLNDDTLDVKTLVIEDYKGQLVDAVPRIIDLDNLETFIAKTNELQ